MKTFEPKNNEAYEQFRILSDKVKVKLFLFSFLTEHHAMKAYWGVEV